MSLISDIGIIIVLLFSLLFGIIICLLALEYNVYYEKNNLPEKTHETIIGERI